MYRNVNYAQIRTESLYVFVDNDFISTFIDQTIIEFEDLYRKGIHN
jgi:hypothetical protein